MSVLANDERVLADAPWRSAVESIFPAIPTDKQLAAAQRDRLLGSKKGRQQLRRQQRQQQAGPPPQQPQQYPRGEEDDAEVAAPATMGDTGRPGGLGTGRNRVTLPVVVVQDRDGPPSPASPASPIDYSAPVCAPEPGQLAHHERLTRNETDDFLRKQVDTQQLDLSGNTKVSNPVLWQAATTLAATCKSVNLRGNGNLNDLMMRSLALCLGDQLEAIDAAGCPTVTDNVVQSLVVRLFTLRYVNLSTCKKITNSALKALADGCKLTLTSVDVSHCPLVGDVGVAWLAGAVGSGEACRKLLSLNLEGCSKVRDRALEDLGGGSLAEQAERVLVAQEKGTSAGWLREYRKRQAAKNGGHGGASATNAVRGCPALQFINVRECVEVSSKGMAALAGGCKELRVVNVHSCKKVGDSALCAIGASCRSLQSLCATRCPLITDKGLKAIGGGCPMLQSIVLAGCVKITEGGICAIAENCAGLQTLNVTGCIDITENGLKELLRGLPFVDSALTYVGFRPKGHTQSDVRHLRLTVQHKKVVDAAASRIQAAWTSYRARILFKAARQANVMFKTALRVQRLARGARARVRVRQIRVDNHRQACAKVIQEWFREVRVRLAAWRVRQSRLIYVTQVAVIVRIQALHRGRLARRHYPDVVRVIEALRDERWVEAEEAVAVRLQGMVRMHRAYRMMKALSEEHAQRQRDEEWGAREIQRMLRGHLGRQEAYVHRRHLARSREVLLMREAWVENAAVVPIQAWVRARHNRLKYAGYRLRETWAVQVDRINATTIQCAWRSYVARCLLVVLKRDKIVMTRAILKLQRIYRGHKIKGWRDIKFDMMRNRVRKRYEQDAVRSLAKVEEKRLIKQGTG